MKTNRADWILILLVCAPGRPRGSKSLCNQHRASVEEDTALELRRYEKNIQEYIRADSFW